MVPNFLFTRLTTSFTRYNSAQIHFSYLLQHKHNASLFLFSSFTSDRNDHKGDTFTMSYLINSCGVSPTLARKLSNRVNLKSPDGPDAVLDLLKNYGLSKTHVAKLVEKRPLLLVANAENTLLPKLKFFRSIGVSDTDMPSILIANPAILMCSLEKCLIPRYETLRSVVRDDQEALRVFRKTRRGFSYGDLRNDLIPNIEVLRQSGVPEASISFLMLHYPSVAYMKQSKFVGVVKTVKKVGLDPFKVTFIKAICVLLSTSKTLWESKFEVYETWGWNREMALRAFGKFPDFMKLSKETYTKKMSFLVKDMGLPSEDIAEYPPVLGYNLEKRMIPRFSVIKVLISKGLLENNVHLSSFMCITEENFLKKFVIKFQEDLPLLSDVYKGLIDYKNVI